MLRPGTALALSAWCAAAAGAAPIRSAPAPGSIRVDGRLDEPAWAAAEPFDAFLESFPRDGAAPRERTVVRVLQGASALYVGIRCYDARPAEILRPLGRRDAALETDVVRVLVDPRGDGRGALLFAVTAGGVQADALVYDDDRVTYDWDATWDGAAAVDEAGWSAELAIPLALLRARGPEAGWRLGVVREVGRTRERAASFPRPRGEPGLASRLGALEGVEAGAPGASLELEPYVAARLRRVPRAGAAGGGRLLDPAADAGADLRARAGSFAIAGAVNPDFGQVESDELLVNLGRFEPFFPEKRPFFHEGLELFQPVGAGREQVPQQLFYSRRIGLDAPILGAAKVVGEASPALRLGVVDALVAGDAPAGRAAEGGLRWRAAQPLHLARAGPDAGPGSTGNFLAAVARWDAGDRTTLGAQLAASTAIREGCAAAGCGSPRGDAVAVDFATGAGGGWFAYGQAAASRAEGGEERTLPDGVVLRPGDAGAGAYVRAGKRGGEGPRFSVGWSWASPRLELNAAGYQPTQNEQEARARLEWAWPRGAGPLEELALHASGRGSFTTDGRALPRGAAAAVGLDASLREPRVTAACELAWSDPQDDVRELTGLGIPLRRPPSRALSCEVATDGRRALALDGSGYVSRTVAAAPLEGAWSAGGLLGATLRPHPRLESRLAVAVDRPSWPLRYVEQDGAGGLLLARLSAPSLSVTLRQSVALSRALTLQLHGQLLSARAEYGPFFAALPRGTGPVLPRDVRPAAPPARDPGGPTAALVVNAVLRWEARPGTTLFVVYARQQAGADDATAAGRGLDPARLGPATDSVFLKWTTHLER